MLLNITLFVILFLLPKDRCPPLPNSSVRAEMDKGKRGGGVGKCTALRTIAVSIHPNRPLIAPLLVYSYQHSYDAAVR